MSDHLKHDDLRSLREDMAAFGHGISIDEFLKDVAVPPPHAHLFTDRKIRDELTRADGQGIRYRFLLRALGTIVTSSHGIIPVVGGDHRMFADLKELRALSDKVFTENKLLVVAGFVARSVADDELRACYEAEYEASRRRIKGLAMDYFEKIEALSDRDLIIREGFVGRLGDLVSGLTSPRFRYRNGEAPRTGDFGSGMFRAANSPWLLADEFHRGEYVVIRNLNYCSSVDEFLVLAPAIRPA